MKKSPDPADENYQEKILQDVSRTFALTIPCLPGGLRRVVSNAYLLCRIADTIEDDNALNTLQTRDFSDKFIAVVAGELDPDSFASELYPLLSDQTLPAEHDLIKNTPAVIRITHSFNQNQQKALLRCIRIMAQGMADFQETESLDGLDDLPAMDNYCYYVAGVVGEMLTELFCDYSAEINQNRDQLMKLAVSFGQGLQMTNILKDTWDDRKRGACWLPRDIFLEFGVDLGNINSDAIPASYAEGLAILIAVTRNHLENALEYTLLLPAHETGLRQFCLWALGMAVLTLNKINKNRIFTSGNQVKISRRSVKGTILVANLFSGNNYMLRQVFRVSSRHLPKTGNREKLPNTGYSAL